MAFLRSKTSFNGGELTERLYSRDDTSQYANGCKTMTNVDIVSTGSCRKRNGTQFVAEVKDSSKTVRLVKFQYTADVGFVLEFGENYIRFYTDKARIEDGGSPVEISSPWTESELQALQYVQFESTLYIVHPDHQPRILTRNSSIDWVLNTFDAFPPPSEELGYSPSGITITPSATTGFGVNFTASSTLFLDADVGRQIINLTEGETGRASIVSVTSGTVAVCDIVEDFTDTNAIAAEDWKLDLSPICDLTPDGQKVGSIVNITADATGTTSAINAFRSDDVGKYILMHNGVLEIIELNSASDVDCEVLKSLTSEDETGNWTLEEPTWSATRGYPRAVGMFEQRLIFGGTTAEPQSLWMSEVGLLDGFGVGANDDDAIDVDITTSSVNRIEWIAEGRDLVVGTAGGEVTIMTSNTVLAPTTIQQRKRTPLGSDYQQVATAGSEILFIPKSKKSIRTFVYNFDIDGYKAEDLTRLSRHMLDNTQVKEIAVAQEPDQRIYAVLNDGKMMVGTFDRDQKVIGWVKYEDASGTYEQVTTANDGELDQVWVVVNRTINGGTKRYIEVFDNTSGENNTDGFSDSFLTYSGGAVTTVSGLDHLEGEVVEVKVNGAAHASATVSSGEITLNESATSVTVGLAYDGYVETLDDNLDIGRGSFIGQDTVSYVEPILHVVNSYPPNVNGQTKPIRTTEMEMDTKPDLYTGFLKYEPVDAPRLQITMTGPFPCELTGITGSMEGSM